MIVSEAVDTVHHGEEAEGGDEDVVENSDSFHILNFPMTGQNYKYFFMSKKIL